MTKVSSKVSPGMSLALFVKVKLVPGKRLNKTFRDPDRPREHRRGAFGPKPLFLLTARLRRSVRAIPRRVARVLTGRQL